MFISLSVPVVIRRIYFDTVFAIYSVFNKLQTLSSKWGDLVSLPSQLTLHNRKWQLFPLPGPFLHRASRRRGVSPRFETKD